MNYELSVVMPCLNEADTLETCIKKAKSCLEKYAIQGEIIIADNGSTDGSQEIAVRNGARVVNVKQKGYGSALKGGINEALGKYIIMGDADDSYDFLNLYPFIEKLREGYDLVMGNRFKGGVKKGAMPFLHRYIGNPVLSFVGRLFFSSDIGDFHCGLRGFTKEAFIKMRLTTEGMEFASEIVVKANLLNLKIAEVPTTLSPDGRTRKPHLRTWRDGWRHLRFLLIYSPRWLFLFPGITFIVIGLISSIILIIKPVSIGRFTFDIHTLLFMSTLIVVGIQFVCFYGLTKIFAVSNSLLPKSNRYDKIYKILTLERGLIIGFLLILLGLGLSILGFDIWAKTAFSSLQASKTFRIIIPATISISIGVQIVLFSFYFSILGLEKEKKN